MIYAAAGAAHFSIAEDFENIYPQLGSWGIWYLPGSKEFWVAATGVGEIIGGVGLAGGSLASLLNFNIPSLSGISLASDSALFLFALTVAVTPANIYMYTHGAKLPVSGPEVPIAGHIIRGILQVILLGLLLQMAAPTLTTLMT